jgi:hypothetical protein
MHVVLDSVRATTVPLAFILVPGSAESIKKGGAASLSAVEHQIRTFDQCKIDALLRDSAKDLAHQPPKKTRTAETVCSQALGVKNVGANSKAQLIQPKKKTVCAEAEASKLPGTSIIEKPGSRHLQRGNEERSQVRLSCERVAWHCYVGGEKIMYLWSLAVSFHGSINAQAERPIAFRADFLAFPAQTHTDAQAVASHADSLIQMLRESLGEKDLNPAEVKVEGAHQPRPSLQLGQNSGHGKKQGGSCNKRESNGTRLIHSPQARCTSLSHVTVLPECTAPTSPRPGPHQGEWCPWDDPLVRAEMHSVMEPLPPLDLEDRLDSLVYVVPSWFL